MKEIYWENSDSLILQQIKIYYRTRSELPCQMTIPVRAFVCFRERGCGSACQGDSPRYALLSLMYAARVYANLHRREVGYQSSLKEGIRANNAEQQWVFRVLNCVQYRRYSLSSVSLTYSRRAALCFRMLQWGISFFFFLFFCSRLCYVTIHKPIGNYVCIFSLFFLFLSLLRGFYPFADAHSISLSLVIFCFFCRVIKFVQTRMAKHER